jgi:hypothetical protein
MAAVESCGTKPTHAAHTLCFYLSGVMRMGVGDCGGGRVGYGGGADYPEDRKYSRIRKESAAVPSMPQ